MNLRIAHEHVCAWNANVCEDGVAHVYAIETHLQVDVVGFAHLIDSIKDIARDCKS